MLFRPMPLLAASALALSSCASGPTYLAPQTPTTVAGPFLSGGAAVTSARVQDEWWRLYNDPVLDRLVTEALTHNTDIRIAIANLARARAALREVHTDRLPEVAASASATYGRASAGQVTPSGAREGWTVDSGVDIAYEADLFGRVTRQVEAARGDAGAAQADADAVRVAVAANTIRAYADAASAGERLAVARRIVALLDQSLTVTTRRIEVGMTTKLDSSRIAAVRNQRAAEVETIAAERQSALFRLGTLTGRAPRDLPAEAGTRVTTLRLDQPIPVGDGAALIGRRPDVSAAERRLAAATARIGVATADLYPRISLGASIGSTSGGLGDLFGVNPLHWLLGPLISWSFSNHERARARVAGAEAGTQSALAVFDGTVLKALEESETALSNYAHALDRRSALKAARDQAEITARITRAQQREGQIDSLAQLDAERTFAGTEADLALADAQISDAQIDLFRALGGGWQNAHNAPVG